MKRMLGKIVSTALLSAAGFMVGLVVSPGGASGPVVGPPPHITGFTIKWHQKPVAPVQVTIIMSDQSEQAYGVAGDEILNHKLLLSLTLGQPVP